MDGMLLWTMSVVSRPGARSGGCTPDGVDPPRAVADIDAVVAVQILHAQAQGAAGLGPHGGKPDRREREFVAATRKIGAGLEQDGRMHGGVPSHCADAILGHHEIGRASCRARGCQQGWNLVVSGVLKKKNTK